MRRSCITLAALVLAMIDGVGPCFAFQEIPVPAASPSNEAAPKSKPPALALGTPSGGGSVGHEGGLNVFGYEVMPKLDFGLELLYGHEQQPLELQGLNSFEGDGDVSVLGKVKRRF